MLPVTYIILIKACIARADAFFADARRPTVFQTRTAHVATYRPQRLPCCWIRTAWHRNSRHWRYPKVAVCTLVRPTNSHRRVCTALDNHRVLFELNSAVTYFRRSAWRSAAPDCTIAVADANHRHATVALVRSCVDAGSSLAIQARCVRSDRGVCWQLYEVPLRWTTLDIRITFRAKAHQRASAFALHTGRIVAVSRAPFANPLA